MHFYNGVHGRARPDPLRRALRSRTCCLLGVFYCSVYLTTRTRASAAPSARTSSLLEGLGAQQHEAWARPSCTRSSYLDFLDHDATRHIGMIPRVRSESEEAARSSARAAREPPRAFSEMCSCAPARRILALSRRFDACWAQRWHVRWTCPAAVPCSAAVVTGGAATRPAVISDSRGVRPSRLAATCLELTMMKVRARPRAAALPRSIPPKQPPCAPTTPTPPSARCRPRTPLRSCWRGRPAPAASPCRGRRSRCGRSSDEPWWLRLR